MSGSCKRSLGWSHWELLTYHGPLEMSQTESREPHLCSPMLHRGGGIALTKAVSFGWRQYPGLDSVWGISRQHFQQMGEGVPCSWRGRSGQHLRQKQMNAYTGVTGNQEFGHKVNKDKMRLSKNHWDLILKLKFQYNKLMIHFVFNKIFLT